MDDHVKVLSGSAEDKLIIPQMLYYAGIVLEIYNCT